VRRVVGPAIVDAALDHLAHLPGDGPLRTAPIEREPFFADIVGLPAIVALAWHALGGDVEPFGATYVVKPPFDGVPTRWHQDGHPWEARGITRAVSIGIALDPSTRANGCLLVIPGSHALSAQPLWPVEEPANTFGAEIDPALVDASLAVPVELDAGDAALHHPNVIHGAEANRSALPRRTLVLRYRAA
jgi:phytanoyl-CoA hydroxylase